MLERVRVDIVFCRRVCLRWPELQTKLRVSEDEVRMVLITVSPDWVTAKSDGPLS